jgi:hypothetical protein
VASRRDESGIEKMAEDSFRDIDANHFRDGTNLFSIGEHAPERTE